MSGQNGASPACATHGKYIYSMSQGGQALCHECEQPAGTDGWSFYWLNAESFGRPKAAYFGVRRIPTTPERETCLDATAAPRYKGIDLFGNGYCVVRLLDDTGRLYRWPWKDFDALAMREGGAVLVEMPPISPKHYSLSRLFPKVCSEAPAARDARLSARFKRGPMPGVIPEDLAKAQRAGPMPKVEVSGGDGSRKVLALGSDGQFFVREVPRGYVTRDGEEREL